MPTRLSNLPTGDDFAGTQLYEASREEIEKKRGVEWKKW
jgi:hypothetical protein